MSVVGLTFGERFTRLCVLDSSGQVVEDGRVRSTEEAYRRRFASMAPSTIGLTYDSRAQHLIQVLSGLGHSVVFGGPVPAPLCPALQSLVPQDPVPALTVARRSSGCSEPGLSFLIETEPQASGVFVSEAWYFAGPISPGSCPGLPVQSHAGLADAYVLATKLYECSATAA